MVDEQKNVVKVLPEPGDLKSLIQGILDIARVVAKFTKTDVDDKTIEFISEFIDKLFGD